MVEAIRDQWLVMAAVLVVAAITFWLLKTR